MREKYKHIREVYYLNNWYRYKVNLKTLDEIEMKNAKMLFKALKELPGEDRSVLAAKYDKPTVWSGSNKVHPNDEDVAKSLDMPVKEYSEKRRQAQRKLNKIMINNKMEELNV